MHPPLSIGMQAASIKSILVLDSASELGPIASYRTGVDATDRRAIAISGIVQGVGFRPYVCQLASDLRLHGFVKNSAGGVLIEVEGETLSLDSFLAALTTRPPPL